MLIRNFNLFGQDIVFKQIKNQGLFETGFFERENEISGTVSLLHLLGIFEFPDISCFWSDFCPKSNKFWDGKKSPCKH